MAAAGSTGRTSFSARVSIPPPPGASPLPGLEVAGTIEELGAGVSEWKAGDAVCALTPGGGYAEFCVTPAAHCLPVPHGWTMIEGRLHSRNRLHRLEQCLPACAIATRRAQSSFMVAPAGLA